MLLSKSFVGYRALKYFSLLFFWKLYLFGIWCAFAINYIYANNNNGYIKSKSRIRLALLSNLFSIIMKEENL